MVKRYTYVNALCDGEVVQVRLTEDQVRRIKLYMKPWYLRLFLRVKEWLYGY